MFDPMLLRTFTVVADSSGFTKAAARLHLTQSTVSSQIRRLEEDAGRPLFARTTRKVALTPAGEALLGHARNILRLNEIARRQFSSNKALAGAVRLGASEDFASGGLARALAYFRTLHLQVQLHVEVGISRDLVRALDVGELDLVIGKRKVGDPRGEVLWTEPIVWAYAKDAGPLQTDVLPLAFFPEPCVYRQSALQILTELGTPFEIVYVSPSFSGLTAAASSGLALTPLPMSLMHPGLRVVTPEEGAPPLPNGEFALFMPDSAATNPIVLALAETLRSVRLHSSMDPSVS